MARYVFPRESCSLADDEGTRWTVTKNVPVAADDPVVRCNPSYFADEPTELQRTQRVVEQATAGPGEQRRTRVG
jgi:hypothetical protein